MQRQNMSLVSSMIHTSWRSVFDEELLELYQRNIDALVTKHIYNDNRKDMRYWVYSKEAIYCVPSILNTFKPYNTIDFNTVTCIIIYDSPKPVVDNYAGIPHTIENEYDAFTSYVKKFRNHIGMYSHEGIIKLDSWLSQGILPIYAIPTTYSLDTCSKINEVFLQSYHENLWKEFTTKLINNILKVNPNMLFICYSKTCREIFADINKRRLISNKQPLNLLSSSVSLPTKENISHVVDVLYRENLLSEAITRSSDKLGSESTSYLW